MNNSLYRLVRLAQLSLWALATITVRAESAGSVSIEDRFKALETQVGTLRQENAALRKQIGWDGESIAPAIVRGAASEKSLKLGGFVQGQGEFGRADDARFAGIKDRIYLRRARFYVSGAFAENFDFKFEADVGANSLSERSGAAAQLTDLYINWSRYSRANVKFGQFKTPFGYEQLMSDTKIFTIERALPNDRLTEGRQLGLAVSGNFAKGQLGYSVGAFNGSGTNTSANDNSAFMWVGRVTAVPFTLKTGGLDLKLTTGVAGFTTKDANLSKGGFGFDSTPGGTIDNLFTGERSGFETDAQFRAGVFGVDAEYLWATFSPRNPLPARHVTADGWSVAGHMFLVPKVVQAVVRYETYDPNRDLGGNTGSLWTLGANYYLKGDDIKLMLNYLLGAPAGSTTSQNRLLTRVQIMF